MGTRNPDFEQTIGDGKRVVETVMVKLRMAKLSICAWDTVRRACGVDAFDG